ELTARVSYKPVLLAGVLKHWGQKGPAEIPAKRKWTYRWGLWTARELGIPFRFPAQHPFNPPPYLRLAVPAGSTECAVRRIFESLWTVGDDALDERRFDALCAELGVDRARVDEAKDALRLATSDAASRGVFGVPSFAIDGEVFWGSDSLDFLKAFL